MSEPWYEVVEANVSLTQGDLIFDCPLLAWQEKDRLPLLDVASINSLKHRIEVYREDVIVMTQACDLEHGKIENVVLCPHLPLSAFRQIWQTWMMGRQQSPSEKAWKRTCEDIANGYVWNQAFLNRAELPNMQTEIRVVDFHDVFTIPRNFLEDLLKERQSNRLRLRPPYREHLSQAFARFFMRVGLPQSIEAAW